MCWYSAAQLLDNKLLQSVVDLIVPSTSERNDADSLTGWPALLQVIRCPQFTRFEVAHRTCVDKFDAFTLQSLAALSIPKCGSSGLMGVSSHEAEFLGALIDLAGSQAFSQNSPDLFLRVRCFKKTLLLRTELFLLVSVIYLVCSCTWTLNITSSAWRDWIRFILTIPANLYF